MSMVSTREAYGAALEQLGGEYHFYVLDADLSKATQTVKFAQKYPERFIDMGIAEQNMMGYAAGLSAEGTLVFASSFAAFAAGRAYDQVRNGIAYANCNVKIGATHGGILIGADGGSHQCIEDIALMRVIPNMTVLCPADQYETFACVRAALEHQGPVYLRFGRFPSPDVYEREPENFRIGKGTVLRDGTDVTVVAIGDMVSEGLRAAELLEKQEISAAVIDMASVKPLDQELLVSYANKTGAVVTAEDHSVIGGLGGAVSEVLSRECPVRMAMVGVQDRFGRSGEPKELAALYGLTAEKIAVRALALKMGQVVFDVSSK